jgi:uncharacterized protein YukE
MISRSRADSRARYRLTRDCRSIRALDSAVEGHGSAVHENQVDLWMRHPETLDQILYRLATSDDMRPRDLSALRRQEVVQ